MATRLLQSVCLAAMAAAAGCAGTRSVSVRVADAEDRPIEAARVLAIPMDTSPVPLPVTMDTIAEFMAETRDSVVTGPDGTARLRVLPDRRHEVYVLLPPTMNADGGSLRYMLAGDADALEPTPGFENPPGVTVEAGR